MNGDQHFMAEQQLIFQTSWEIENSYCQIWKEGVVN